MYAVESFGDKGEIILLKVENTVQTGNEVGLL